MPSDQLPPRAAPMEGEGAYNRNSVLQAAQAASALQILELSVHHVPVDTVDVPLLIADYGCSQGANSLAPMTAAITAFRKRIGTERPIWVVHNDQPGNDFASLFQLLEGDPASYLRADQNVFPLAVGRSFFGRVLPPESVTVGWSSYAVHWLSRVPAPVPDAWHALGTENAEVRAAYLHQSAEDWRQFLAFRAQELCFGGRLVVTMAATSDDGSPGWGPMFQHMQAELHSSLGTGLVSAQQSMRMVVPTMHRSRDALLEPFGASGCFAGLTVEHLDIVPAPDPIWEEFLNHNDASAFGAKWGAMFRVTLGPSLATALPVTERRDFLDRTEAGLAARLGAEPEPMTMWVARIVLMKSGRGRA